MSKFEGGNWGSHPMPCTRCNHQSRDHDRSKKQSDGTWNGKCKRFDCNCPKYIKPITGNGKLAVEAIKNANT